MDGVRLGDIATVKRGYEDPPLHGARGRQAGARPRRVDAGRANIITLGQNLKRAMSAITAELPVGIEVTQIADQPHIVNESVSNSSRPSWKHSSSCWSWLPVARLAHRHRGGAVGAAGAGDRAPGDVRGGARPRRITLGALIIARLLVDDAIIAIEVVVKMEQGWDQARAATFAWTSTAFPMLTGTLVTAAGFLPVGFAKSSAGEYAGGIFWIVGLALIASWVVAVLFTPISGSSSCPT
jgi:multidrug efflux pump subunit AcrB